LRPGHLVERIHALVLAGGSAFGLEAATGVMRWCEERGIGFDTGVARIPIVPAAILFDLRIGEPSASFGSSPRPAHPDAAMGYAAAEAAARTGSDSPVAERSEERRVGKEWRSGGAPERERKNRKRDSRGQQRRTTMADATAVTR